MDVTMIRTRMGLRRWAWEGILAALALAAGFGLMPALIFVAGSAALGRYEGASIAGIYRGVYQGLQQGSIASWTVVLGPYLFYLLSKALRVGWRAGTGT